jgi:hypothetical protein
MGLIVPKTILSILFLGLVLPVGFVRRLIGNDSLKLLLWKRSSSSVFNSREQTFVADDLERPY